MNAEHVTERRTVRIGHAHPRFGKGTMSWVVRFRQGRAETGEYGHRPKGPALRRLRRLAVECEVNRHQPDREYSKVSADFVLYPNPEYGRSSIIFKEGDGAFPVTALKTHVPPAVVDGIDDERERVESLGDVVEAAGPPAKGTEVFVAPSSGVPHVVFGDTTRPQENDGRFPADAALDFLAGLRDVVDARL